MQQDVAAATHAEALTSSDSQVIEQCEHIFSRLLMPEWFRQNARPAVAAQVRHDQLKVFAPRGGHCFPILTRTRKTMQQEQWLTGSVDFEIELNAVKHFGPPRRLL
jgi:hypothetical protein